MVKRKAKPSVEHPGVIIPRDEGTGVLTYSSNQSWFSSDLRADFALFPFLSTSDPPYVQAEWTLATRVALLQEKGYRC